MPGPILWGPNNIATNLQNAELLANGSLISYNGPKNYITYGNFENGATTGWSLGTTGALTNGLPTGSPTFGSGAAGTLSIATVSSGQIAGLYSLSLVSSAATTQGNMVASQAYTIDAEDQGKVLTYRLAYSIPSGVANANFSGTSSNSFGVGVYDVTNSAWLGVTGAFNLVQNSGVGIATGTFQTAITTASIRLVFYCVNATTGAVTVYLDDISVGPQVTAAGAAVTDFARNAITLTFDGLGTTSALDIMSRRVGDSLEVYGKVTAGTVSGTTFAINLPGGITMDTAKLPTATNGIQLGFVERVGGTIASAYATNTAGPFILFYDGSTNNKVYVSAAVASSTMTKAAGNGLFGNSDNATFSFLIPVTGWSSQTVMSNDTDTRVVDFIGTKTGNEALTADVTNCAFVTTSDSHGAWNGTQYTIPVSGDYWVSTSLETTTATTINFYAALDGVKYKVVVRAPSGNAASGALLIRGCKAGQALSLRSDTNITLNGNSNNVYNLSISRISGPATIAASEKVYLQYTGNAGNAITANVTNLTWSTKVVDSHNAWNGTTFTAPKTGLYYISGTVLGTSTGNLFYIYKNAAQNVMLNGSGATSARHGLIGQIYLLAGDTVTVREDGSDTLTNSATDHSIAISSQG